MSDLKKKKPDILAQEIIASTQHFNIEALQLRFSNGEERVFERIVGHSRGAVLVVPFLDPETILLIREYGAGVHDYHLGFPKGLIDHGEDSLQAADRELKEEVGYGARKLQWLTEFASAPGYHTNRLQVVVASDLYECRLLGDEPEPLEVVPWPRQKINDLLLRADFIDVRSIAAALLIQSGAHDLIF